jgi:hypothetical protein
LVQRERPGALESWQTWIGEKTSAESEANEMKNPFGPEPYPSSYLNLKERMTQHVKSAKVEDQIFQILQKAYEDGLKQENIMLSRPERQRMFAQIMKQVLEDMAKKLDKGAG